MKKVFITGASGFIGKNLINRLLEAEVEIYALVMKNEIERIPKNNHLIPVIGNLNDVEEIEHQIKDVKFDVIFHLAWEGVSTSYKNEFHIQMKNINYALNIMQIARRHRCKKVIITGSVSEYAYCKKISSDQMPIPSDFYSATKASVHIYCDFFTRLYKDVSLNWTVISSIYGPGREDDNILSYTIKALLYHQETQYTKLEQMWDYVYIDDVISALLLIARKGIAGKVYQIGSGQARMLKEYIIMVKQSIDSEAILGIGKIPYKTERIDNSIVDIRELQKDTGYCPAVTFETGIEKTIAYFRKRSV